jgi:hypothetical protein
LTGYGTQTACLKRRKNQPCASRDWRADTIRLLAYSHPGFPLLYYFWRMTLLTIHVLPLALQHSARILPIPLSFHTCAGALHTLRRAPKIRPGKPSCTRRGTQDRCGHKEIFELSASLFCRLALPVFPLHLQHPSRIFRRQSAHLIQ